jgi:hypothetical protein
MKHRIVLDTPLFLANKFQSFALKLQKYLYLPLLKFCMPVFIAQWKYLPRPARVTSDTPLVNVNASVN